MKKRIVVLAVLIVAGLWFTAYASAAQDNKPDDKKVLVCKYVGTPGVNERLQTGTNPIEVAANSINPKDPDSVKPGDEFADKQGRSVVVDKDGCPPATPDKPKDPVACPASTTLVYYKDDAKQDPVCKDDSSVVEDTTPEYVPTPDGGMKDPVTGEVFYGK